jgi:conjugal transfer/type IV secretion protein DotA/TraY
MQSNNQNKVSVSSGLAFAFLPQFKYCFAGLREIIPLFGVTLAIVLSHAKLIRKDHPVLDGGRAGIGELMGEAWYTLRTTQATTTQWGVFSSIVLFAGLIISAVSMFVLRIGLGVGSVAHAQLFSAANDPYGQGVGISSIQQGTQTITPVGASAMFDSRVTHDAGATGALDSSKDYALMLLDKVLRQAASTPQNGGSLQNALASLMEVYNSAVLIVASVIIFWMIMSIVVDTAKAGVIGGGRHNMVWTPIRVVFALGIMIPLGSQGFSSGQYMVMKLAEWGSNLGSRAWSTYIGKVLSSDGTGSLLLNYSADNVSTLVNNISQAVTCQVVYNAFSVQSGTTDTKELVSSQTPTYNSLTGMTSFSLTTDASDNMCGTISYQDSTKAEANTYVDPITGASVSVASTPADYSSYSRNVASSMLHSPTFIANINKFESAMTNAIAGTINASANASDVDSTYKPGPVMKSAREFACIFVARRFSDGGTAVGDNAVNKIPALPSDPACNVTTANICGGLYDPATGNDPTNTCQETMSAAITGAMKTAYDGNAAAMDAGLKDALLSESQARGWADMGLFLAQMASINVTLKEALQPKVSVTPGTAWVPASCGLAAKAWNGFLNWFRSEKKDCVTDLQKKVSGAMDDYGRWWDYASTHPQTAPPKDFTQSTGAEITSSASASWKDIGEALMSGGGSDNKGLTNMLASKFTPKGDSNFMLRLLNPVDGSQKGSFPLAQLTDVGHTLIWVGAGLDLVSTVGQALAGAIPFVGAGMANLFIWSTMVSVGNSLIFAGIILLFWLPVLPTIRVAMAALTWITAVFVAVAMVPIAALAHLSSEGEGIAGGAKVAWILWLNILLRPVLVVLGFVGAILIYNSFAVYFNSMFGGVASMILSTDGLLGLVAMFGFTAIYVMTLYTAANACFKMLDLVPDSMMTWMGGPSGAFHSFDGHAGEIQGAVGGRMAIHGHEAASGAKNNTKQAAGWAGRKAGAALKAGRGEGPKVTPNK